jgi:hypothetical protein
MPLETKGEILGLFFKGYKLIIPQFFFEGYVLPIGRVHIGFPGLGNLWIKQVVHYCDGQSCKK